MATTLPSSWRSARRWLTERFELGETVEVKGHVLVDQDLGLGYRYAVLLDASRRIRAHSVR